jgi:hypothetical protein
MTRNCWARYFLIALPLCCDGRAVTRFLDAAGSVRMAVTVSGLSGTGLKLSTDAESLPVTANGSYSFSTRFAKGTSYSLRVQQFPANPNQHCAISGAQGIAGNGDIALAVNCGPGSAAGPMVAGTVIHPLNLSGNADLMLGQIFAGVAGASALTDGTGTTARFIAPTHMVSDGVNIYLLEDNGVGTIRRIAIATREVTTLGAMGGSDGITTDGFYLYTSSFNDCTIRKMNLTDLSVSLLAGAANICAFADAATGPGSAARFNNLVGITHDGSYLYVADYSNNRIRRVDPVTGATTTLAGTGVATSVNGPAATATFSAPHGLTYFAAKLFVAEGTPTSQRVRVIDLGSAPFNVTTLAGTGAWGCGDGASGVAEFKKLRNLATDGSHLYATDKECFSIRRIDLVTGFVSTLSGSETRTTTVIGTGGGLAGTASFREPIGITADGSYLYATDSSDFILRRIE